MSATFPNPLSSGRSQSLVRAADALLRTLGGESLALRVPLALVATGPGLVNSVQDVECGPAIVRQTGNTPESRQYEVVLSGATVQRLVESLNTADADELFASALGIVRNGVLLRIASVSTDDIGGEAYLYRLAVVS
jgi:hypothetical protein